MKGFFLGSALKCKTQTRKSLTSLKIRKSTINHFCLTVSSVLFLGVKPLDHTDSIVPFKRNFSLFVSVPDWLNSQKDISVVAFYLSNVEVFLLVLQHNVGISLRLASELIALTVFFQGDPQNVT